MLMKNNVIFTSDCGPGTPADDMPVKRTVRTGTIYPDSLNLKHRAIENRTTPEFPDAGNSSSQNILGEDASCKATATQIALLRAEISLFMPAGNCR